MEILLWQIREVRLWHHHVALLLPLHNQVLCSLLGKMLVRVIASRRIALSLWIVGLRMLLVRSLRFNLSVRKVRMVLGRGDLRHVVVNLHIGRHSGRLAHWLRLRVPWKLSNLEGREFLLPPLRTSAFCERTCRRLMRDASRGSHDEAMPFLGRGGLGLAGQ